jgi:hypothetical protein
MTTEIKKPARPTQKQYNAAEINLALGIINIKPCQQCGWPVHVGYCCGYCGSDRP